MKAKIGYTLYIGVKSLDQWQNIIQTGEIENIETESFKKLPSGIKQFGLQKSRVIPQGVLVKEEFDEQLWKEIPKTINLKNIK